MGRGGWRGETKEQTDRDVKGEKIGDASCKMHIVVACGVAMTTTTFAWELNAAVWSERGRGRLD